MEISIFLKGPELLQSRCIVYLQFNFRGSEWCLVRRATRHKHDIALPFNDLCTHTTQSLGISGHWDLTGVFWNVLCWLLPTVEVICFPLTARGKRSPGARLTTCWNPPLTWNRLHSHTQNLDTSTISGEERKTCNLWLVTAQRKPVGTPKDPIFNSHRFTKPTQQPRPDERLGREMPRLMWDNLVCHYSLNITEGPGFDPNPCDQTFQTLSSVFP